MGQQQEAVLQQHADHKMTYGEIRLVTGWRWERLGKDAKTNHAVVKPLFFAVNAMCICV